MARADVASVRESREVPIRSHTTLHAVTPLRAASMGWGQEPHFTSGETEAQRGTMPSPKAAAG